MFAQVSCSVPAVTGVWIPHYLFKLFKTPGEGEQLEQSGARTGSMSNNVSLQNYGVIMFLNVVR